MLLFHLGHAAALVHHAALGGGGVQGPAGGLARVVSWGWPGGQLYTSGGGLEVSSTPGLQPGLEVSYTWPLTLLAGLQGQVARLARVVAWRKLACSMKIINNQNLQF